MTAYQWATVLAVVCLLALMMWRPVVELAARLADPADTLTRIAERAAEGMMRAAMGTDPPPPPRRDDDDQGYVY